MTKEMQNEFDSLKLTKNETLLISELLLNNCLENKTLFQEKLIEAKFKHRFDKLELHSINMALSC